MKLLESSENAGNRNGPGLFEDMKVSMLGRFGLRFELIGRVCTFLISPAIRRHRRCWQPLVMSHFICGSYKFASGFVQRQLWQVSEARHRSPRRRHFLEYLLWLKYLMIPRFLINQGQQSQKPVRNVFNLRLTWIGMQHMILYLSHEKGKVKGWKLSKYSPHSCQL